MKSRDLGFSYVEVLVATVLIAIALVPAIDALQTGVQGSAAHVGFAVNNYRVLDKLEEILARPFADLEAEADAVADPNISIPPPYSDPAGTADRRLVYIARYDGDNADADKNPFTGVDDGLLWIRVRIDGTHYDVETLIDE